MAELRLLANQILAQFDLPPSMVVPSSKENCNDITTSDDHQVVANSRGNGRNNATITFYPSISTKQINYHEHNNQLVRDGSIHPWI
eukprot:scaffold43159_cov39-Cyclotella_meneghiniana.AAC.3